MYNLYKYVNKFYEKLKKDICNQVKKEFKDIFDAQVQNIDEKIKKIQGNTNAQQPRYFGGYGITQQPRCNFECCNKQKN